MRRFILSWPSLAALLLLLLAGCSSVYYGTWEKLGKHKRDLLRDNVEAVREEQQEASDQFKDALTQLLELTGGAADKDLEDTYNRLNKEYERCQDRAEDVRDRIAKIDRIADDLFAEWKGEIDSMHSPELKAKSRSKLVETQRRYVTLERSMRQAERRMGPVLTQLRDQVLFLKHNLNASAIAGLRGEVRTIELDVHNLLRDMKAAIAESDRFIAGLPE